MEVTGMKELLDAFANLPEQVRDAANRGISRATVVVHAAAVANAPRSPTQQQLDATRKHGKQWLASNRKNVRERLAKKATLTGKPTGHSRPKPGGLERAIGFSVDPAKCEGAVFVSVPSEAMAYAKRIHDEKGVSWGRRGLGTSLKGTRADDKFIERARDDNADLSGQLIEHELKKVEL